MTINIFKTSLYLFVMFLLTAATGLRAQTVRDIYIWPDGSKMLAAGEKGLLLQSVDNGQTWHETDVHNKANFESIVSSPGNSKIMLLGGLGVPGYPGGTGKGVLLESFDDAQSFKTVRTGPAGWLYTGVFAKARAAIAGQAAHTALGGMFTTAGSRQWQSVELKQRGYVLGSSFKNWKFGYLVGSDRHIVSLENLLAPKFHAPEILSRFPLRASAFQASGVYWAVGDNATVLKSSDDKSSPWQSISLPLPKGSLLTSDFTAIDFLGDSHCVIAGGLGCNIYISTNGGKKFRIAKAPPNCGVNSIRWLDEKTLIAGGDGGLWRSNDSGQTWQQVYGQSGADVLIVAASCDETIWPAITLHASAGLRVAVLFATAPRKSGLPPQQQLRAAAITAGASAVYVLGDFPSYDNEDALGNLTEKQITNRWDDLLDINSTKQLASQIAAAIMKYRPAAILTGPIEPGHKGAMAEVAAVARATQQALQIAETDTDLAKILSLKNHKAQRFFTAQASNYKFKIPWKLTPVKNARKSQLRLDLNLVPFEKSASLGFYSQLCNWLIAKTPFPYRLPERLLYNCDGLNKKRVLLATQGMEGLKKARAKYTTITATEKMLVTGRLLAMSNAEGRLTTMIPLLVGICVGENKDIKTPSFNAKMIAADLLATVWYRLAESGKIIEAIQAMDAFERFGQIHPLYKALNVSTLMTGASSEFRAMIAHARSERPKSISPAGLVKPFNVFLKWHPWCDGPNGLAGRAKLASLLDRPGEVERSINLLEKTDFTNAWTAYAKTEWAIKAGGDFSEIRHRKFIYPKRLKGNFKLDGKLNDEAWQRAKIYPLVDDEGNIPDDGPVVRILRTRGEIAIGIEAPDSPGRNWKTSIALDTDRDTWTQQILKFDSAGQKSSQLLCRTGPSWTIPKTTFRVKNFLSYSHTFEAVFPMKFFDPDPRPLYWGFQIKVVRDDKDGKKAFYLNPQSDARMLPHRYGLLVLKTKKRRSGR